MRNKNAKVSDPNSFVTNPGNPKRILYSSKVCPNGEIILKPCGEEDIQEYINSFRESTDMSFILHQLSIGNTAVLNSKQMMFGDFSGAPDSLAEALQVLIDGETAFNQLPMDVRSKFDNNFRNWLFTSGEPDWMKKMESDTSVKEDNIKVESEVNADVS